MLRRAFVASLVASAVLLPAGAALASGNKTASPSSIVLNQAAPMIGQTITFSTTYPGSIKNPRVQVICWQGTTMVWGDAAPAGSPFVVGGYSSPWTLNGGGAANCEADLYYWTFTGQGETFHPLASMTFDVAG